MEKIFVQIASFCDRYLIRTVNVALKQAQHPRRITFGVCAQDQPHSFKKILEQLPSSCNVVFSNYRNSKGVGWARRQAQNLLKEEDYTLQIDAHMDFTPGWDVDLIQMWRKCKNEKAIFSQLCHDWRKIPRRNFHYQTRYTLGISSEWYADCWGIEPGKMIAGNKPERMAFICGHMVFAPSTFFAEVPIDPLIGYAYEENSFDVRAWTNGWDIYSPNLNVIRHSYGNNAVCDMDLATFWDQTATSHNRWRRLIGLNPNPIEDVYGLGKKRTMDQWFHFSGINFITKMVTEAARKGLVLQD